MSDVFADRFPEPTEAMQFLERKVNLPTDSWDELKWGEHGHAFTVAHSNEAAVLDTIHGLLNKAMKEGLPFQDFRNGMLDMMKATGWYGGAGHTEKDKIYINHRIKVIYETNMLVAYAQARYRQQLQNAELRPIWVYQSQLTGKNRRQEHITLHGRAYRYDDSFWDKYYPPNGWLCKCYVTTKSESGAERDGIKVGDSSQDNLPDIDETWAYNPGQEALAPNFSKYKNIPKETLKQVQANYHQSMNNTRMTNGEFCKIIQRTNEADYKPLNINYEVGNLETRRFQAMQTRGIADSKVMASDKQLWHGTGDKTAAQKIPEAYFPDVYETLNDPEQIYEETMNHTKYRVFHFVKTVDGKKIKLLLHQKNTGSTETALELRTLGYADYDYTGRKYEKIW